MANRADISPDDFEGLLAWLAPDREVAASKYLEIHSRLFQLFRFWGCDCAEDLADLVMDRVANNLVKAEAIRICRGGHIPVFLSFSKYVHLEYLRKKRNKEVFRQNMFGGTLGNPLRDVISIEKRHQCLEKCLQQLSADDRELLPQYHSYSAGQKVAHRQKLAQDRQTTVNALRQKVCRLKSVLAGCVRNCVQGDGSPCGLTR